MTKTRKPSEKTPKHKSSEKTEKTPKHKSSQNVQLLLTALEESTTVMNALRKNTSLHENHPMHKLATQNEDLIKLIKSEPDGSTETETDHD